MVTVLASSMEASREVYIASRPSWTCPTGSKRAESHELKVLSDLMANNQNGIRRGIMVVEEQPESARLTRQYILHVIVYARFH
jgi:hypothetical protein